MSNFGEFKELVESPDVQEKAMNLFPHELEPNRFFGLVINQFSKMEERVLKNLDRNSSIQAVAHFASIGMYPDPFFGYGWFVPFWNKDSKKYLIQPILGYLGLVQLLRRTGEVLDIQAEVVRKNDVFEDHRGTERKLIHRIDHSAPRGELHCAYAIITGKDGGKIVEVCDNEHMTNMKRAFGMAKNKKGEWYRKNNPWNDPIGEPWMWRKTPLNSAGKLHSRVEYISRATRVEEQATYAPGENENLIEINPANRRTIALTGGLEPVEEASVPTIIHDLGERFPLTDEKIREAVEIYLDGETSLEDFEPTEQDVASITDLLETMMKRETEGEETEEEEKK